MFQVLADETMLLLLLLVLLWLIHSFLLFLFFFQVRIQNFLEKTKNFEKHKAGSHSQEGLSKEKEILRKRVKSFIRKKRIIEVQRLVKNEELTPWGRDTQAKVCGS